MATSGCYYLIFMFVLSSALFYSKSLRPSNPAVLFSPYCFMNDMWFSISSSFGRQINQKLIKRGPNIMCALTLPSLLVPLSSFSISRFVFLLFMATLWLSKKLYPGRALQTEMTSMIKPFASTHLRIVFSNYLIWKSLRALFSIDNGLKLIGSVITLDWDGLIRRGFDIYEYVLNPKWPGKNWQFLGLCELRKLSWQKYVALDWHSKEIHRAI